MTTPYIDPIIQKYLDLIKAGNTTLKFFYQGDPIKIPASSLPAVIIAKTETRAGFLTNAEDDHGIRMTLTLITDVRDDFNDEAGVVAGISSLYDIMEGREPDLTLKATSILDILRSNALVDVAHGLRTDLETVTRIDYSLVNGKRAPEAWSTEATIDFVANFNQVR